MNATTTAMPGAGSRPSRSWTRFWARRARSSTATTADPDVPLCREYCGKVLRCEAERMSRPLPEGDALKGLTRRCQKVCEWGATDWTRPQIRQCVAGGCDALQPCSADAAG